MLIKYNPEDFLQKNDDVYCVTGVTGITGPSLMNQYQIIDLPAFFKHAVEEAATESKMKRSVATLSHLQYFMHSSNHNPINWEDLTHDHMTQYVWCPFVTYMGKYARNKTKVKFDDCNSSDLKNSKRIKKSNKDSFFSQGFIPNMCKFKNRHLSGNIFTIRG